MLGAVLLEEVLLGELLLGEGAWGAAGLALGSGPLLAGVFVAVAGAGGLGPEGAGVGAGAGGAEKLPANWSPNGVPLQPASSRQPATSTKLRRPAAAISDRPP